MALSPAPAGRDADRKRARTEAPGLVELRALTRGRPFHSAAESAAWGYYENATIVGATGAAAAGSAIMRASPIELLQKTGKVVSTLGKAGGIGMLGLVGVTLVFDPKLVVTAATPPQCTGS